MTTDTTTARGLRIPCRECSGRNRVDPARLQDAACGRCQARLAPVEEPIEVDDGFALAQILAGAPLPVVIDFWAGWCAPCAMVKPEIARLARQLRGRALVLKVDTDAVPAVWQLHALSGIPAFLRFDQGREVARSSGAQPAEAIAAALGLAWSAP